MCSARAGAVAGFGFGERAAGRGRSGRRSQSPQWGQRCLTGHYSLFPENIFNVFMESGLAFSDQSVLSKLQHKK